MVELTTKSGWHFFAGASVCIGEEEYDMDELNEEQRRLVGGKLQEQLLNASFAGEVTFRAEGLPDLEAAFPRAGERQRHV